MPISPGSDPTGDVARPRAEVSALQAEVAALEGEAAALREEVARAQDRHRRALADLDNYRKRIEREGDRRAVEARRALLREWLEAIDSVERALRMEPGDPGLTAVLAQMEVILARHGITRISADGTRFDPERHEAIAVQETDDAPDYAVLEVARSGFLLDDGEVLRPTQVLVARRPAGES